MRNWNERHFLMCFLYFWTIPTERKRHAESTWSETGRDRKDVASDLEPDETRHMMCPSNPPTRQDSTNTPAFFLFLVFTSICLCNIVSAWSCLLWPTVSLFCRSGKDLAWRFHALFSVSPLASEDGGVQSQNFVCFHLWLFMYPFTFAQITLSCSYFRQASLHLQILFHVVPLCNYSFPSSIAFACLFLYFREPLLSAGHGVLPSVQDDMSGWRDTSCVHPLNIYSPY